MNLIHVLHLSIQEKNHSYGRNAFSSYVSSHVFVFDKSFINATEIKMNKKQVNGRFGNAGSNLENVICCVQRISFIFIKKKSQHIA